MGKLFYHAMCNRIDELRDGLEKKIEPVDTYEDEITPLFIACQDGNLAAVELLLKHGANIYLRDKKRNDTCLQRILIIAGSSVVVPKYANYPGCFRAILQHEQRLPVSERNPELLEIVNHRGMRPADYIVFKLGRSECPKVYKVYTELQQALNDHLRDLSLEAQPPQSGIRFLSKSNDTQDPQKSVPLSSTSSDMPTKKDRDTGFFSLFSNFLLGSSGSPASSSPVSYPSLSYQSGRASIRLPEQQQSLLTPNPKAHRE